MKNAGTQVMMKVNATYGADLTAHELAAMIADPRSAIGFGSDCSTDCCREYINVNGSVSFGVLGPCRHNCPCGVVDMDGTDDAR